MACSGTTIDGSPCPNEFTNDDGLCPSCAAPKGMALVAVERAVVEFDEELPLKCRLFLEAYMKTCRLGASAKALGMSVNQHKRWLGEVRGHKPMPGYSEAFEVALQDVQAQADDDLLDTIERGLKEVTFDADNKLKHTRFRQSEGLIKMHLMALNREKYAPDNDRGSAHVTIILNRTREGGWVDTVESVPEAEVLSDDDG